MPDIEELYNEYNLNQDEVVFLGIARLDRNDVKQELQNCGFKNLTYVELNEHFYIVMATV